MNVAKNSLFHLLLTRYRQFGGLKVVRYYAQMDALWPMLEVILRNPFSRSSYKNAYTAALRKVEPYLIKKYRLIAQNSAFKVKSCSLRHEHPKVIWWCWLQGLNKAPAVVQACYNSLVHSAWFKSQGYTVKVIDNANWRELVELPDYIVRKWSKNQIPPANFADLLRLQLLIKYGGTWVDSTVLCTSVSYFDFQGSSVQRYLEADLFMFQYKKPESDKWGGIGNWFISSCSNNEVLMVLRDMLFAYWKDYDCLLDYYMFHLFFSMLKNVYPLEIAAMPYGYAVPSVTLVHHWNEKFDKEKWERFTSKVCFHKLAYSVKKDVLERTGTYYEYILDKYQ